MTRDTLKKIIKYGTYAPSGDNSQPWKFIITQNNDILLYNLAYKDNPILNVHQGGSLLSHGAVIENIKIASKAFGYNININYFPDKDDDTLVARLSIKNKEELEKKIQIKKEQDLNYIKERCTNRKPYLKNIKNKHLNNLIELKDKLTNTDCQIKFFTSQNSKNIIAKELCLSEQVILETKELHNLLYKDVVWTKRKELIKRHGLFVKTLEFNPIQEFVFWLCRKWQFISFLNKLGFSKFIAKENEKLYKNSGLIGFLLIPSTDKLMYIRSGEIMQKIWLETTKLGLSFQPVTGLFFLHERIKNIEGDKIISDQNRKLINESYEKLKNSLKLSPGYNTLISFRIGQANKTKNRSSRLPANIILK